MGILVAAMTSPYRDGTPGALAPFMKPVPAAVSRAEHLAWRVAAWGPPALGVYAALVSTTCSRPLGQATPIAVLVLILWGVTVYGVAYLARDRSQRAWRRTDEALLAGDLDAAEGELRRMCTLLRPWAGAHAGCLGKLGQVAMLRGDLDAAQRLLQAALFSPWMCGPERAGPLYTLSAVHALGGNPAAGRRALLEADAVAPRSLAPVSGLIGAQLAIAEGDFEKAAAELEARSKLEVAPGELLRTNPVIHAIWAYCLARAGAPEDQVRRHVASALPLSRRMMGHYVRAWPDFGAFLVEQDVAVEA